MLYLRVIKEGKLNKLFKFSKMVFFKAPLDMQITTNSVSSRMSVYRETATQHLAFGCLLGFLWTKQKAPPHNCSIFI